MVKQVTIYDGAAVFELAFFTPWLNMSCLEVFWLLPLMQISILTSVKLTDQASGWHCTRHSLKGRKWRNYAEVKKDHEREREREAEMERHRKTAEKKRKGERHGFHGDGQARLCG